MRILDRYIIRQFLINYILLFLILTSLILLLNLIINFNEFLHACQDASLLARLRCVLGVIIDYNWPAVFLYFSYLAGFLPIAAAGFTLANLIRRNELTAMLASGWSMRRIARPLLIAGCLSNLLLLADQEIIIPRLADKLARTHADLSTGGQVKKYPIQLTADSSGALLHAGQFDYTSAALADVTIILRDKGGRQTEQINAASAEWDQTRKGWKLIDASSIRLLSLQEPSAPAGRQPRQVDFFASDLDPHTLLLKRRERYRNFLSQSQLAELAEKPQIIDTEQIHFTRHNRFAQVAINILVLPVGLFFFLLKSQANLLAQTVRMCGHIGTAWGLAFMLQKLALGSLTLSPAVAAWLPIALLLPIAAWYYSSFD